MKGRVAVLAGLIFISCAHYRPEISSPTQVQELSEATVKVMAADGTGSGTIIYSKNGHLLILTCAHVVEDDPTVLIKSRVLEETTAVVEKVDKEHDLALLGAERPGFLGSAMPLALQEPALYERIFLMGSPLGIFGSFSEGYLADKTVPMDGKHNVWAITGGFILFGISGGTGMNARGELVCVPEAVSMVAGVIPAPQLGFCIGLSTIKDFLQGYPHA